MNASHQLSKMLSLATAQHAGQFDKGGMPYILHPLKVMHYLKTDDMELMCIALGHDLLEDTYDSIAAGIRTMTELGFSSRVMTGIIHLTRMPDESYEYYKERVKANMDAVRVKMADLRHNSDIRRLKGVTEKDIQRAVKYHQFYLELKEIVENSK